MMAIAVHLAADWGIGCLVHKPSDGLVRVSCVFRSRRAATSWGFSWRESRNRRSEEPLAIRLSPFFSFLSSLLFSFGAKQLASPLSPCYFHFCQYPRSLEVFCPSRSFAFSLAPFVAVIVRVVDSLRQSWLLLSEKTQHENSKVRIKKVWITTAFSIQKTEGLWPRPISKKEN